MSIIKIFEDHQKYQREFSDGFGQILALEIVIKQAFVRCLHLPSLLVIWHVYNYLIILCLKYINYIYSQGRGAFKDKTELKTTSKYTLRHTESRVKICKRLRGQTKDDDKSMILVH